MSGMRALVMISVLILLPASTIGGDHGAVSFEGIGRGFEDSVRPLLKRFCLECHSTDEQQGELDLERFTGMEQVRRAPRTWQKVVEMLDNGEMPPKRRPQPSAAQREEIRGWVRGYLDAEAKAGAGDPGSVVLRRLSNVEFDNTIRDLTGVDLRPAREFPVDGAAGEGFTNVGEALAMSPAMLDKYVTAAKKIASHAVLLPDGFRFSGGSTRRDWTDEIVSQIRLIYRRHTDPAGSDRVNLHGLTWETNSGGRLPLEPYLAATLAYREARAAGGKSLAAIAAEHNLEEKYLRTLWDMLDGREPSPLIDEIRAQWRSARPDEVAGLASEIRGWQAALTKFQSVAHFKPWQVPIDPIAESRTFRLKLQPGPGAGEIVLRLVTRDAGDGPTGDLVEWKRPRLESPDRPPLLLRDVGAKGGLPRDLFGKHPSGHSVDEASLVVQAPSKLDIRLPAELAAGREFVVDASLDRHAGIEGSVQAQVIVDQPLSMANLVPDVPVLARDGGAGRKRAEESFAEFRRVFPAALCYAQIVPVDEVVTLVLFHREDEALTRLMLDERQSRELDRLWDELRYVSRDAIKVQEAYGQFMEYVTQDGDVRLFEPLRRPIAERAAALGRRLVESEPKHLDALVAFASRAYRRPLSREEQGGLRDLYADLRAKDLDHDAAFRLTLARVLMAPSFLYRAEQPAAGEGPSPVSDWELASRLSYFLWSSLPDAELRRLADEGKLHDPEVLAGQARRMLDDERVRALATEFACQWLDIRGFDAHDEKSERAFPEFAGLRGAMYEESVRFFVDLFRRDGPVLDILDADHTFVDGALARHYGIPGVDGPEWRRVEGIKSRHRGGILGMATLLAKQSGASRTSPVLRGNWLSEMLLGEKLPRPPKDVPPLPDSELETDGLTMRQITEKHRAIESCAKCHDRIDSFGFALEGFDAIGRRRDTDLAGRPIDTRVRLKDGTEFADIDGLRGYLLSSRREEFLRQFCRKLLGYALGRSVQLSDEPLLDEMRQQLSRGDHRVQAAILTVIRSPQFLLRRGLDSPLEPESSSP